MAPDGTLRNRICTGGRLLTDSWEGSVVRQDDPFPVASHLDNDHWGGIAIAIVRSGVLQEEEEGHGLGDDRRV